MKRYSHDNWNQVYQLPDGPDKSHQLKTVGRLATGNLVSFVRRILGHQNDIAYNLWLAEGRGGKRSRFLDYMDRL